VPGDGVVGVDVDERLLRPFDVDRVVKALPQRPEIQSAPARLRMRKVIPQGSRALRRNELEPERRVRGPALWIRHPPVMDQRAVRDERVEVVNAFAPPGVDDRQILVASAILVRPCVEVSQIVPGVALAG
jgi:hypothetical protein